MRSAVAHALGGNLTVRPVAPRPCRAHTSQQRHHLAVGSPQQAQQQRHFVYQQQQQQSLRSRHLARAERTSESNGGASTSSTITDSDISFLGKLLVFSFAGAAAIKYGSLVFELPFQPNPAVALTLVLGTPAAYSLFLLTKGDVGQQQQ